MPPLILPEECIIPEDMPDCTTPGRGLTIVQELGTCDEELFPEAMLIGNGHVLAQYRLERVVGDIDPATGRWIARK